MAIRAYQIFFSALMPSACKFYPSCSKYGAIAIQVHGARHGSWLALRRLARCHPFTPGGVDLVPEAEECQNRADASGRTPGFRNGAESGEDYTCNTPESEVHS